MGVLEILFIVFSILLIFIILIQPARGEGIASAFGGAGSDTFFGTKAHQQINRFTIILSIIVFALAILITASSKRPEEKTVAPEKAPPPKSAPK